VVISWFMRIAGERSGRRRTDHLRASSALAACLWLTALHPLGASAFEILSRDGFEDPDPLALDCERLGYPCTLAEADPDALARADELLAEIWDIRNAGTMEDVRIYLESQPDVEDIISTLRFASFRVEGMSPVIFDDITTGREQPAVLKSNKEASLLPQQVSSSKGAVTSFLASRYPISGPQEVVGRDTVPDGRIDQRDYKLALVMSPYEWELSAGMPSSDLAALLNEVPGYEGGVTTEIAAGPDADDVQFWWRNLSAFDVAVVATHGGFECVDTEQIGCVRYLASGWQPSPDNDYTGAFMGSYFSETPDGKVDRRLYLTPDFFKSIYGGSLTERLVVFSASPGDSPGHKEWASAMGGKDFVLASWDNDVNFESALGTTHAFFEQLARGLNTSEALGTISPVHLNPGGSVTELRLSSPGDDDVRIYELPRLMYRGATMPDAFALNELIVGVPGDGNPDTLNLTLQIDGVTDASSPDFEIRYRVDDKDTVGAYGLGSATSTGALFQFEVNHQVELGFPLDTPGLVPIEVIAELPEGGDTRFTVDTVLASCYHNSILQTGGPIALSGPAQYAVGDDDSWVITLSTPPTFAGARRLEAIIQTEPGISSGDIVGVHTVASASVNIVQVGTGPIFSAWYVPGVPEWDCAECGGVITINEHLADLSLSGDLQVTLNQTLPIPDEPVVLDSFFVAAAGSNLDPGSPINQCLLQYPAP